MESLDFWVEGRQQENLWEEKAASGVEIEKEEGEKLLERKCARRHPPRIIFLGWKWWRGFLLLGRVGRRFIKTGGRRKNLFPPLILARPEDWRYTEKMQTYNFHPPVRIFVFPPSNSISSLNSCCFSLFPRCSTLWGRPIKSRQAHVGIMFSPFMFCGFAATFWWA